MNILTQNLVIIIIIIIIIIFKLNDQYDVIKASLIFMSCLKAVWNEGQKCSNSNRYISGTNWIFCMQFSAV